MKYLLQTGGLASPNNAEENPPISEARPMADELTEKFRKLCVESEKRISLPDLKAVQLAYGQSQPSDN